MTLILFLVALISPSANANVERCERTLEVDCYYVLKRKYSGLEEFEMFWIGGMRGRRPTSFSGKAYIHETFVDLTGTLENRRILFVVSMPEGFSYKFVGKFHHRTNSLKVNQIVIEGRLSKFKGRERLGSKNVELYVGHGGNT